MFKILKTCCRFFCNKLWNATKFAMMYLGAEFKPVKDLVRNLHSNTKTSNKPQFQPLLPAGPPPESPIS